MHQLLVILVLATGCQFHGFTGPTVPPAPGVKSIIYRSPVVMGPMVTSPGFVDHAIQSPGFTVEE